MPDARARAHPAAVTALVVVAWVVGVLLATSDTHGEGARDVGAGDTGGTESVAVRAATPAGGCPATVTNPGGRNNYRAGAAERPVLGRGLVVEGTVRGPDCGPLPGVRLQLWAQTATAGESTNVGAVRTGPDGRYRWESDPLRSQFGEPNIHLAHDGTGAGTPAGTPEYARVVVRHVVAPGTTRAEVDLVLRPE